VRVKTKITTLKTFPLTASRELRQAAAEVDSNVPITGVQTLSEQVAGNFDEQRLTSQLVGFSGGWHYCWRAWACTASCHGV
jgi:hypothetical protein